MVWDFPDDLNSGYATNMLVQAGEHEMPIQESINILNVRTRLNLLMQDPPSDLFSEVSVLVDGGTVTFADGSTVGREEGQMAFADGQLANVRQTSEFLAAAWFHKIDWAIPRLELGYWLRSAKTGNGIMTEAVNALTRYAFEIVGAKRLEIQCDKENVKSRAVPERLGYKLDAVFAQNEINLDGTARDTCVYSRLDVNGLPKLEVSWGS